MTTPLSMVACDGGERWRCWARIGWVRDGINQSWHRFKFGVVENGSVTCATFGNRLAVEVVLCSLWYFSFLQFPWALAEELIHGLNVTLLWVLVYYEIVLFGISYSQILSLALIMACRLVIKLMNKIGCKVYLEYWRRQLTHDSSFIL